MHSFWVVHWEYVVWSIYYSSNCWVNIIYVTGCVGLICPCYLFGRNAESLGSGTLVGSCMMHFVLWALVNTLCCVMTEGAMLCGPGCLVACYACGYRRTLRENYNLEVYLHFLSIQCIHARLVFVLTHYRPPGLTIDVDQRYCFKGIRFP